ncbi:hypothetical protein GWK47_029872 [Chionoecetes opilio]|uniref:Uncharacterized protein n=1 Tax=Chionoecetes opilio TaxID=41210 RepID=A0A8J4YLZ0_CHIOP|nr:hypothetical protein GWK47_029872 [Chionoecetes opilio]
MGDEKQEEEEEEEKEEEEEEEAEEEEEEEERRGVAGGEMESSERKQSEGSFSSLSGGRGGGGSEISDGRRSRMLSLSSSIATSVLKRSSSRVEVVDMPGGSMLVKVSEEDAESQQGSLDGARTLAGVMGGATDTTLVDKIIKQEMWTKVHQVRAMSVCPKGYEGLEEWVKGSPTPRGRQEDRWRRQISWCLRSAPPTCCNTSTSPWPPPHSSASQPSPTSGALTKDVSHPP